MRGSNVTSSVADFQDVAVSNGLLVIGWRSILNPGLRCIDNRVRKKDFTYHFVLLA